MIYYVHDAMAPITARFNTMDEAVVCGEKMISEYREYADCDDGWGDVNIAVYACETETDDPEETGKQVAVAQEIIVAEMPDDLDGDNYSAATGEWWNPDWDYLCDFKMVEK